MMWGKDDIIESFYLILNSTFLRNSKIGEIFLFETPLNSDFLWTLPCGEKKSFFFLKSISHKNNQNWFRSSHSSPNFWLVKNKALANLPSHYFSNIWVWPKPLEVKWKNLPSFRLFLREMNSRISIMKRFFIYCQGWTKKRTEDLVCFIVWVVMCRKGIVLYLFFPLIQLFFHSFFDLFSTFHYFLLLLW